ncbi:Sec-independent protein translocase subunit TatA [Actinomadura oligospora]|uniref:Sec-independent protein translocase subunit TatA n=1 Tax=Actinomadura oligospora TaxID=111804 RepID=UPI00047D5D3A|nr:Sec-independent protein translocase subunit TatA [Actinomadura oligospora]
MAGLGTTEILILLLIVVLIFGSAKLPQLARSLGKSARILKAETKGLVDDDEEPKPAADKPQAAATAAPADDARDRAARLREEAARLEREAAASERRPGALPSGEPIEGVPVERGQYRANG